jgi:hypothetical protein
MAFTQGRAAIRSVSRLSLSKTREDSGVLEDAAMMTSTEHSRYPEPSGSKREPAISVYCKLFSDIVPIHVCSLRKKELNTFGWLSCNGCAVGLAHYWSRNRLSEGGRIPD